MKIFPKIESACLWKGGLGGGFFQIDGTKLVFLNNHFGPRNASCKDQKFSLESRSFFYPFLGMVFAFFIGQLVPCFCRRDVKLRRTFFDVFVNACGSAWFSRRNDLVQLYHNCMLLFLWLNKKVNLHHLLVCSPGASDFQTTLVWIYY